MKIIAEGSKALEEIKLRLAVRKTRSQMAIYSLITAGKKQDHEKEQGKEGGSKQGKEQGKERVSKQGKETGGL